MSLAPMEPGVFWFGNLSDYRYRKIEFLSRLRDRPESLVRFKLGRKVITLLKRPEDIFHVEQKNHKNYVKATQLRDLVGDGILMSEGEKWRKQRRLIQPTFHLSTVSGMVFGMNLKISEFLSRTEVLTRNGPIPFDLGFRIKRLVFEVVLSSLFSSDRVEDFDPLAVAMEYVNEFLTMRFNELIPLPLDFPAPSYRRFKKARSTIDSRIESLIELKREEIRMGAAKNDLMTQMILSRDPETGTTMDQKQLRDEAVSILLAGFETTSHLLSWTLSLLKSNPESLKKLLDELDLLPDGVPTVESAYSLPFLNQVLDETLRLYPPVWAWTKRALGAETLGEYQIEKGDILYLSPYLVHRDPKYWENPNSFVPERFTPELREQNKLAFFPFGLGPRTCVGRHFAILEAKLFLIRFLKAHEFDVLSNDPLAPAFRIVLGQKNPLEVLLKRRLKS